MQVRTLRCLDGIFYALIVLLIVGIHSGLGRDVLGNLLLVDVVPILALGWCAFRLPSEEPLADDWAGLAPRLRFYAVASALLCPFLVWYLRNPSSYYLLTCFALAAFALIGFLFEFTALLSSLGRGLDRRELEMESKMTHKLVFFLLFVPACIFCLAIVINSGWNQRLPIESFFDVLRIFTVQLQLPYQALIIALLIFLLPVALTVSLLMRTRIILARYLAEGPADEPEDIPEPETAE